MPDCFWLLRNRNTAASPTPLDTKLAKLKHDRMSGSRGACTPTRKEKLQHRNQAKNAKNILEGFKFWALKGLLPSGSMLSQYPAAYLSTYLPIYLIFHPSTYPSRPSAHPSIHLSVCLSIDLSVCLPTYLPTGTYLSVSICLSSHLNIHASLCT